MEEVPPAAGDSPSSGPPPKQSRQAPPEDPEGQGPPPAAAAIPADDPLLQQQGILDPEGQGPLPAAAAHPADEPLPLQEGSLHRPPHDPHEEAPPPSEDRDVHDLFAENLALFEQYDATLARDQALAAAIAPEDPHQLPPADAPVVPVAAEEGASSKSFSFADEGGLPEERAEEAEEEGEEEGEVAAHEGAGEDAQEEEEEEEREGAREERPESPAPDEEEEEEEGEEEEEREEEQREQHLPDQDNDVEFALQVVRGDLGNPEEAEDPMDRLLDGNPLEGRRIPDFAEGEEEDHPPFPSLRITSISMVDLIDSFRVDLRGHDERRVLCFTTAVSIRCVRHCRQRETEL